MQTKEKKRKYKGEDAKYKTTNLIKKMTKEEEDKNNKNNNNNNRERMVLQI